MPREARNHGSRRFGRIGAARGFTLVELMIVVAIVGVLAVLGIVGYRKLTLSAKVTEAKTMISAIRIAQEDYKVERGIYANLGTTYCPNTGMFVGKTGWDPGCTAGGTLTWATLPVHVDGPVQFGYATVAGGFTGGASAVPGTISWVDTSAVAGTLATKPWYVVMAKADLNGDGALTTDVVGTSFDNNLYTQNEGE